MKVRAYDLCGVFSGRNREGPRLRPPHAMGKIWLAVDLNRAESGVSQMLNNGVFGKHAHLKDSTFSIVENEVPKFLDYTFSSRVSQNKGSLILDDREIVKLW